MKRKLVVYSTSWCMPCKALKERLTAKGLEFEVVDAEENDGLCVKYSVRNVPTIFIMDGEQVVQRWSGNIADDKIQEIVDILNGKKK